MTLLVHRLSVEVVLIFVSVCCLLTSRILRGGGFSCFLSLSLSLIRLLVDDLVDGGLFVARTGHNVLIVGRDITA